MAKQPTQTRTKTIYQIESIDLLTPSITVCKMVRGNAYHGAGQSNVGFPAIYEAGDQRNEPQAVINERHRYEDGKVGSHQNLDSKDQRSIANKLAAQETKPHKERQHQDFNAEAEITKRDPTLPAKIHGNTPSKGAQIDKQLQEEDEQRLREKGIKK
ncbi:hypothetical protein ASPZODRAFT_127041 [Penicilliopsis zonata CBS 506.65]|uniref:Uncharacterized protein n=1 Tax=Penicilliopsis zonata CBS 506.65 TaxID=1073090 RepID=A0A1L9SV00_9EURO|nr:hypothetical protein ASPZODRAFT_127041 [Penicilliopsis zonata CBS 506.65]OJJ51045.1 hypothetical protein ASPZODRAFT_127041 [Penicilliopsis zonata CBS 506.65]